MWGVISGIWTGMMNRRRKRVRIRVLGALLIVLLRRRIVRLPVVGLMVVLAGKSSIFV
jgi:hypothetical protein